MSGATLAQRVWGAVQLDGGGCWIWTRARSSQGYGSIKVGGRQIGAHRVAYEVFVGPIPDGLELDHLCRNPSCVNPAHLEPVTTAVNILRGTAPAALNSRKTHCANGHPFDEQNTYVRPGGAGRSCRTCGNAASRAYKERRAVAS